MIKTKLGIVLSGGGAKGAYEAGFLRAMAEFDIQPDAIAGTSIGALNGAIYSAQVDTHKSARIIEDLWRELGSSDVLEIDKKKAVKNLVEIFTYFAPMPVGRLTKIAMAALKGGKSREGILTQKPIVDRLKRYAGEADLKRGLPFYIGMTLSKGNLEDLINFAGFGSEKSVYKKVQDLKDEDMHKAIMASAALPILFDGIEIGGQVYRDGSLGSTDNEWGNTPAKPLIENEGCTHLIVCHLNEGSSFDRHDPLFDNVSIIEVRPEAGRFNSILDPLVFNVEKIDLWMEQGYKDTKRILRDAFKALAGVAERKKSETLAQESVDRLKRRKFKLS